MINSQTISTIYHSRIKEQIQHLNEDKPTLVGFLANTDPAAKMYARWTKNACEKDGIQFILKTVDKMELEEHINKANEDNNIHGIMIYYPVFGNETSFYGSSMDDYLRDFIAPHKDVEGLSFSHRSKLYRNIRFMDPPHNTKKSLLPCTPLAIVKILEYLRYYDNTLENTKVTIINRSEIVGRPLAAMLANDGATVYSVDIDSTFLVTKSCKKLTDIKLEDACKSSEVIITGVPTKSYRIPTEWIQPNTIVINVSSFKNVEEDSILKIPGIKYVPKVGKVTVAMLERNLIRCYNYNR